MLRGDILDRIDSIGDLGVIVDKKNSFAEHHSLQNSIQRIQKAPKTPSKSSFLEILDGRL
jgi:hypothetical protein